jgi:hypothetical protein
MCWTCWANPAHPGSFCSALVPAPRVCSLVPELLANAGNLRRLGCVGRQRRFSEDAHQLVGAHASDPLAHLRLASMAVPPLPLFEGLDLTSKVEFIALLNGLRSGRGTTIVGSTHEVNLAPYVVDAFYLLAWGGRLVRRCTPKEILGRPDLLVAHHLEPPMLVALFQELKVRGIALDTALTAQEGADMLQCWEGNGGRAMARQAKPIAESGLGSPSKGKTEHLKPEVLAHRSLGKGPLEAVAVGAHEAADVQDESDRVRAAREASGPSSHERDPSSKSA